MKILKKFLIVLQLVLLTTIISPIVVPVFESSYTVNASNAKISNTKKTLNVKESYVLKVSGTKKKINWSSSQKSVATVNEKGKVTAKKKGTTIITAKVGNKKYECKIKVENPKLSKTSKKMNIGDTYTLKLNGTSQSIKWSTSNSKIATVKKGKVIAKKAGQVTITAKSGNTKYKCKIKISNSSSGTVYITNTGLKYHRSSCKYLKSSKIKIKLKKAKSQGYTACKVCKP